MRGFRVVGSTDAVWLIITTPFFATLRARSGYDSGQGGGCHGTNVSNPELTVEPGARQTQEALVHFGQESEIVSAKP